MTEYDAVLFDNDGVLIEPPADERQRQAAREAFAELGIEAADDEHVRAIASGVRRDRLDEVCEYHGLDAARLWAARDRHDQRLQHEDIEGGVRRTYDDLTAIADCEVACGIVSNNHHATIEFILDHFDIGDHFETYYGRERSLTGIERKKPDPHYLERACEDLDAETALYVGDRESDVRAAHNADLDSAFLARAHTRDADLSVTPTHEIETLHDLPALLNDDAE